MKTPLINIVLCLGFLLNTAGAQVAPPAHWSEGLGEGPQGRLEFRFEVTFMKIDVADIEARLAPETAAAAVKIAATGKADDEDLDRAAAILLAAETLAFRMTFLRDGGLDRFMDGTRKNLEASRKDGLLTQVELESVWQEFRATMESLGDRDALKGDQLLYRIDRDEVWMGYVGAEGDLLIDVVHSGDRWTQGIKGTFLSQDSRFRKKLLARLWRK